MRPRTLVGSLGGTLALLVAFSAPGTAQPGDRGGSHAGRAALAEAESVLSGHSDADLSMALRDVFRTAGSLTGSDLTRARALLSRPTDPDDPFYYGDGNTDHVQCGPDVCVHWTETGPNAATPEFATETLQTLESIHQRYVAAGYRAPLPDQGQGGNTQTDIYLSDLGGTVGAYGYCTTDVDADGQPTWVDGWTVAPYCVFDNDFAEFPWHTPEENLEVTAAHEYFHAVQYAYDANDDVWAYETTATWAEDELYTDINDNLQYLPYGQMGDPAASVGYEGEGTLVPLDYSVYPYGNWTWIRYLTEQHPAAQAGLPTLVRTLWQKLDTTGGKPDTYSLRALDSTLAGIGTSTAAEYAAFSSANRTPAQSYTEGDSYPTPALAYGPVTVRSNASAYSQSLTLDHLTSGTGAYLPSPSSGDRLKVRVDMAAPRTGSAAIALVVSKNGSAQRFPIALNNSGSGQVQVPFGSATVDRVEVTLVNGSSAMKDCGTDPFFSYSCAGVGTDDGRTATVRVQSVG